MVEQGTLNPKVKGSTPLRPTILNYRTGESFGLAGLFFKGARTWKASSMALYFTSDLHLGHEAIIEMNARPFASVEEMNIALIDNINETVSEDDTLFILGDFSYRIRRDESVEMARRIACRNVHLVKGNHDKDFTKFGVFRTIRDYRELRYGEDKRRFVLFHYPIASWAGMRGGSIHLHGHIHSGGDNLNRNNFANGFFRYDVGVDANGYHPVSIEKILELARAFEQ